MTGSKQVKEHVSGGAAGRWRVPTNSPAAAGSRPLLQWGRADRSSDFFSI
jgi:hypothetical protein